MSNENEANKFIGNVDIFWQKLREANAKAANAKQRANGKLFERWVKEGRAVEILSPLLEHSSNAVKQSAADYLLDPSIIDNEIKEKAIEVLRYLVKNDPTLVSSSAAAVLRVYSRTKAEPA